MKRLWFLRHGSHLCVGMFGTAGDEYGRKTWWLRVPFGVVVFAVRFWRYEEIVAEEEAFAREDAEYVPSPELMWESFAEARRADGIQEAA